MSTEVAKRDHVAEVCQTIAGDKFALQLRQALPENVSLDRFTRVTLTAVQQNPELITADRGSLYHSIVRCAQDGLQPDGKQAALVIFSGKEGKKVQYLPMIGGLRYVAANHGITLTAYVVYENDDFAYELGLEPQLKHRPPTLDVDRGKPIGAYAVATDAHGQKYLEVMSLGEIDKVRNVSRSKSEYGPWAQWWDEMARKTVARRLFKQLPLQELSEREQRIIRHADTDTDLPEPEPVMTREEANVSADIGPAFQPDPDEAEYEPVEGEIIDGEDGSSLFKVPAGAQEEIKRTRRKSTPAGETGED